MSAIAGIFNRDGAPVARDDLVRMIATMERRGPDGFGIWHEGPIGLAYRKLATTPESLHEELPLARGPFTLTADARIDNRDELLRLLDVPTAEAATLSDGELILTAFQKWDRACLAKLIGDFAFSVWDSQNQTLFCARDHIGMRPIVYHATDRLFAFASDIRALLALDRVPQRINEGRIADFLIGQTEGIDKTSTFFEGIFKLPPAHAAEVRSDQLSTARFWALDPTDELQLSSDAEYTEAFREVFEEAVRCRLRSATQPASMLSGGLDSAAIVAFARDLSEAAGKPPLDTYSAITGGDPAECPETRSVRSIVEQGGLRSHTLGPTDLGPLLPEICHLFQTSHDLFDHQMHLPHCLYIKAHQDGFNILLDGVDGDLVASAGGSYIAHLWRQRHWRTAIREAWASSRFYSGHYSPWALLSGAVRSSVVPNSMRRIRHRWLWKALTKNAIDASIIAPDLAIRALLADRLKTLGSHTPLGLQPTQRHQHAILLDQPFLTVAIERYDRVAAACSVEPRRPLLDRRVLQHCVSLPWQQKTSDGWTKVGLRRITSGSLPRDVRFRQDFTHLGPEFTGALVRHIDPLVASIARTGFTQLESYVSISKISEAFHRARGAAITDEDPWNLWLVVSLATWLDRFGLRNLPQLETNSWYTI
jgi:asparagine synthase (glutamine-hydrolysing)